MVTLNKCRMLISGAFPSRGSIYINLVRAMSESSLSDVSPRDLEMPSNIRLFVVAILSIEYLHTT
jgi:hypothetical protein